MIFRKQDSRQPRRRSQSRNWSDTAVARLEHLESRCLLAGNVTAVFNGQNAFVTGDTADNSIEIEVEDGNVVVRGLDNTTINGSSDAFVLVSGATSIPRHLRVSLGNGADTFNMMGVSVGGSVVVNGGNGNDQIAVSNGSTISRHLVVNAGSGDDIVSLQDSTVSGHAVLRGHNGNDQLIVSGSTVGRNLQAHGGRGDDNIVIDDSTIGRDAWLTGWRGNDDIVLRNSTIGDDLSAVGHSGNDIIMIDTSTVNDRSRIVGHSGNDNVVIQGASRLAGRSRIVGNRGVDHFEVDAAATLGRVRSRRFSSATADADAIATRITATDTGAIAAAEAAVAGFNQNATLSLTVTNSTVAEDAGAGASTVTATLSAAVDEDVVINLSSSDAARLALQQDSITITAGSTTADVLLDPQDNATADGDATITVSATTTNVGNASIDVTVTDDDTPTSTSVTIAAAESQVTEDTGDASSVGDANQLEFTITRTESSTDPETFALTYQFDDGSDASAFVSGPDTVTIEADQTTATYQITTVPDGNVRTEELITVTAENPTRGATRTTFTLVDNDQPQLDLVFSSPTVDESISGVTLTVSRNTSTTGPLSVELTSSNAERANFGGDGTITVDIPAGAASTTQTINIVDDAIDNGDVNIAVTATATDFTLATDTIAITDNDDPLLTVILDGNGSVAETAGNAAVTGSVTRNSGDLSSPLIVTLSTDDDRLSAPTTVTIPAAQSSANFTLDVIDNDFVDDSNGVVTVTATSGGFPDATTTINVVNDDVATFSISPSAINVDEDAGTAQMTLTRNSSAAAQVVNLTYSNPALVTGPATVTFAEGANIASFNVTIVDNDSLDDNADVTVTASSGSSPDVQATVSVANDDTLTLTTDLSSNVIVESVEAFVTRQDSVTITGQTLPGAVVQVETSGNAAFDEGSAVADNDGNYSVTVGVTHDDTNNGANQIQLRAVVADAGAITTSNFINVHRAVGTVLRFQTNQDIDANGENDFYDIELLDDDAPNTVANFLSYVNDGSFENNIVHRSPPGFVVQGGGFRVDDSVVTRIPTRTPIGHEFSAENSNVRGTLSMAHAGPNTGTSQWFVNVVDNTALDRQTANEIANGVEPHTVFGRVIGNGMSVVDRINQISVADLTLVTSQSALAETPLRRSPFTGLTGTVSLTADSSTVIGTGTQFTTELQAGDVISIEGSQVIVNSVVSDTEIVIDVEASRDSADLGLTLVNTPPDEDYVVFSNIGTILDSI